MAVVLPQLDEPVRVDLDEAGLLGRKGDLEAVDFDDAYGLGRLIEERGFHRVQYAIRVRIDVLDDGHGSIS